MCGGVLEKDLTLDVARRIDRLLNSEGIATLMTRVGDTHVSLADRAAFANRVRDCIFVSIHFNEDNQPVSSGVETYYAAHQITAGSFVASWLPFLWRPLSDSPNFESQNLARFIQEALVARTGALDRGKGQTIFCNRKCDFSRCFNRRRISHEQGGHFEGGQRRLSRATCRSRYRRSFRLSRRSKATPVNIGGDSSGRR